MVVELLGCSVVEGGGEEMVVELSGCSVVKGVVAACSGIVITGSGSGTTVTGSTTGISIGAGSGG